MTSHTKLTHCRCCSSENLTSYLDLGMMPLANNLADTYEAAWNAERFPLEVLFCEDCALSQLSVVIEPEVLFSHYVYRSSINKGYCEHANRMAVEFKDKYNLRGDGKSFVIDIAGNDGALLNEFRKVIPGLMHLNVDPARNLGEANDALGVRQYTRFWSMETAVSIGELGWPKADVITATNVFAHVHDVRDFLLAAEYALKPEGVLVLEFPYLIDFIEKGEWDTVYFEHLSYWAVSPLNDLACDCGLFIRSVEKQDIHGGTIRVTLDKDDRISNDLINFSMDEYNRGYCTKQAYEKFSFDVANAAALFRRGVRGMVGTVACFAASAKGNTLLNYADRSHSLGISYIVDETPEKLGKYTPGNALKVISIADMMQAPPDNMIILSWNFADSIAAKLRENGYKGNLYIPIPYFKKLDL